MGHWLFQVGLDPYELPLSHYMRVLPDSAKTVYLTKKWFCFELEVTHMMGILHCCRWSAAGHEAAVLPFQRSLDGVDGVGLPGRVPRIETCPFKTFIVGHTDTLTAPI